jgi:hypothetical protein
MSEQGSGAFDDRYVRYREHVETKEELQGQLAELRLANARLADLPNKFDEFAKEMRMRALTPAPAAAASSPDQTLLMMHRLLDTAAQKNGGATGLLEKVFVWVLVAVGGGVATHFMGLG